MQFRVGIMFETGRQKQKKPENVENVIFSGEGARSCYSRNFLEPFFAENWSFWEIFGQKFSAKKSIIHDFHAPSLLNRQQNGHPLARRIRRLHLGHRRNILQPLQRPGPHVAAILQRKNAIKNRRPILHS